MYDVILLYYGIYIIMSGSKITHFIHLPTKTPANRLSLSVL
jgi:hypothetical protein